MKVKSTQFLGTKPELAEKLWAHLVQKRAGKGAAISAAIMIQGELVAAFVDGVRGSDRSTASVEDLYNVGSVSKVYCAVAIMKLVEMGKVDLDTPVVQYLPEFSMRDARYKNITVRMLLNHSSGMPGTNYRKAMADHWIGDHILDDYLEYLKHAKLKADPGEFSMYCNDGFDVAAAIVEKLSGKQYVEFLRDEITTPAGALTTGQANVAIGDRRMMSCLGRKPEWVSAKGAGAVRTDLSDCARFGYFFIDPQNGIGKSYLDETAKSQGITFLKNDHTTPQYGLGWDTVSFKNPFIDLGENALGKGGGTGQFLSYLIVSPKYQLSAAISGTNDCQVFTPLLLCELIAVALKELGVEVQPKAPPAPSYAPEPIPQGWPEKYSGVYYSSLGAFKAEVNEERLSILRYSGNDSWVPLPMLSSMQWNGEKFFSEKNYALFESRQTSDYIFTKLREDTILAQKNANYPAMSRGWKNRLNKKYIACNVPASDLAAAMYLGVTIDQVTDDGVIQFVFGAQPFSTPNPFGIPANQYNSLPAVSSGDDDTDMFLNAPGDCSRNLYAPYAFRQGGVEYLRISGYVYISADSVPDLKSGLVSSPKAEQNVVFRTRPGDRLVFDKPDQVVVFLLDENLSIVYSSLIPGEMPLTSNGYILFANDIPFEMNIAVRS